MGFLKINELIEDIYSYLDVRLELFRLDTEEKLVQLNILIFELVISVAVLSIFFLFLNLGLAFYLNGLIGSTYLGFLWVAGIQILFLGLLMLSIKLFPRFFKGLARKSIERVNARFSKRIKK